MFFVWFGFVLEFFLCGFVVVFVLLFFSVCFCGLFFFFFLIQYVFIFRFYPEKRNSMQVEWMFFFKRIQLWDRVTILKCERFCTKIEFDFSF